MQEGNSSTNECELPLFRLFLVFILTLMGLGAVAYDLIKEWYEKNCTPS